MSLGQTEWFLLIPAYALLAWRFREWGLFKPLRVSIWLTLVLALVDPALRLNREGVDLWVLADRSDSAREWTDPNLAEWEKILRDSMGPQDRLRIVDFAQQARLRSAAESSYVLDHREESNLGLAIRQALLLREEDRSSKLLYLGDGFYTDSLEGAKQALLEAGVPLDYRLAPASQLKDFRVSSLRLPDRARVNESFMVEAEIVGPSDDSVAYQVFRGESLLLEGEASLVDGRAVLRFSDRVGQASAVSYAVRFTTREDAVPQNNAKTAWLQVEGPLSVLVLSNFASDPLVQALSRGGFALDVVNDWQTLTAASLVGRAAVIINNVPASRLPSEFLEGLAFFVERRGGGLLLCGGKYGFASGGYAGTAVEGLSPVSMELKQEHKKLAVAMCVVADRSGSMGASVAGTANLTKMDLANAGATQAVQMLGELDAFSYIAVDTEPHVMVPLVDVGSSRSQIIERVERVASMGGGIFVYEGLAAGWAQLQRSRQGLRHLILFADASDAENPGAYESLLKEMVAGKTTVSVIALGSRSDRDAELLQDIARLGGGRAFFNADASDLPALFTQETVAVARSAFVEETVPTLSTAGWLEIGERAIDWLSHVEGYNLCYLKEGATMALASDDEYKAPLVAFWQRGIGRVGAITYPMAGDFSVFAMNWKGYGDFAQTFARWLAGDRQMEGIGYEASLEGNRLSLDLYHDQGWGQRFSRQPPRLMLSSAHGFQEIVWERAEPGRFAVKHRLEPNVPVLAAIQVGDKAFSLGPLFYGSDEEWQFEPRRVRELEQLSRLSRGKSLVSLADAWKHPPRWQQAPLRAWLVLALLLLFLLDVSVTRIGRWWPRWGQRD